MTTSQQERGRGYSRRYPSRAPTGSWVPSVGGAGRSVRSGSDLWSDPAEAAGIEVLEGFGDLGFAVHHEGAVADNGIAQRLPAQHQHGGIAVRSDHYLPGFAIQQYPLCFSDDFTAVALHLPTDVVTVTQAYSSSAS